VSRFVDECRARARHAAGCAAGYALCGEDDLVKIADRIAVALGAAAVDIEALERAEYAAARAATAGRSVSAAL